MKRTIVERVAAWLYGDIRFGGELTEQSDGVQKAWELSARRIIAMVRRHDARKGAKK